MPGMKGLHRFLRLLLCLPSSRRGSSPCPALLPSLVAFQVTFLAAGSVQASRLVVDVAPEALQRAVREHTRLLDDRGAVASKASPPEPLSCVLEVLLPPDTRLVEIVGDIPALVVGTEE